MSNELAIVEETPGRSLSMVNGPDPMAAMAYAESVSRAIASVLSKGNGYVEIQGRKHVEAAGWQTIAAMTGHTCEIEWSRIVEGMDHPSGLHSWEARAIVRDQSGRVVATGESMAAAAEGDPQGGKKGAPWARAEFSIRSMAQTRAMGRALSARMRYVVQLAGFAGAPAEEMSDVDREREALATARARWKVLRDHLGQSNEAIKERVGDRPEKIADDAHFAAVAFLLGEAGAAPVEGEVIPPDAGEVISEDQRRRLLAIGAQAGMSKEDVKEIVREKTGADSTTRVPLERYDEVCAYIEQLIPADATSGREADPDAGGAS